MRTFVQPKATQHTTPAKPTTLGRADFGRSLAVNSIIHLQQMIGNQAVQRRLRTDLGEPGLAPQETMSGTIPGSIQRKRCSSCATEEDVAQSKLPVSMPNDPLEQEADRIAEQVMEGHTPTPSRGAAPVVQRDALDGRPGRLSRGGSVPERLARSRVEVPDVSEIGRKLGFDFSAVRVYASAEAAADALAVGANAYALGREVVVGEEPAALATPLGKRLLTHELVHVAQQGAAPPLSKARRAEAPLSAADAEQAADRVADALRMASRPGPIGSVPAGTLQRQERTITAARIEELRQLARNPQNFAAGRANAWQRLTAAEKGAVMMAMDQWYGVPFTSAFVRFANARQLVAGGINLSRGGTLGEAIFDRTDRSLWRTPRFPAMFPSCTTMIYPDGSEFARCATPPTLAARVRSAVDEARRRQSSGDFAGASAALERERTTVESMERETAIAAGMDPSVTDHDRVVDFIARRGAMFVPVRLPQEVVDWYTVRNDVRARRTRPQTEDEMLEEALRDEPPPPAP